MKGKVLIGTACWIDPGFIAAWHLGKLPALERLRWYARKWVVGRHFPDTEGWFKKYKVTFAMVDTPANPHFMIMPRIDLVTNRSLAYLRAHGRNAQGYIAGRTMAERIGYDYTEGKIDEMAPRAGRIAPHVVEMRVVYNNNRSNYAP